MAFGYLAGVTTPGAADEIVDWFATFQTWMTVTLGWTVEAGGGTVDVIFRSVGELGGLTMLYMRVWQAGNNVHFEMRDDLAGTHVTAEGGFVDSGGVQFAYWMSGDMDAINVCWQLGGGYRSVYAGLLMPFALTAPDETYHMVATSTLALASILRDWNNVWDVDINNVDHIAFDNSLIDLYDGSFTPGPVWANTGVNIAGQYKHISGLVFAAAISAEDTLTTGRPGATSEWICLEDSAGTRYFMRTGGALPTGISMQGASFAVTSGVTISHADLIARLTAFLVARGWTDLGDPGGWTEARLFFTDGESGEETTWVMWQYLTQVGDDLTQLVIQNDAAGTHVAGILNHIDNLEFPLNYWITGDRDCFILVAQRPGGFETFWGGICEPFAPGLLTPYAGPPLTDYKALTANLANASLLRRHDGAWVGAAINQIHGTVGNTNPNAFDGVTYVMWPYAFYDAWGVNFEPIGMMKYCFHTLGGIANNDTITVGGQVYTYFTTSWGLGFMMRTT